MIRSWGARLERAEDPLATALEWFDVASTLSFAMVAVGDTDLRIVAANEAFAAAFGVAPHELAGVIVEDITPPDEILVSRSRLGSLRSGAWDTYRGWRRFQRPDGAVFEVELIARAVRDVEGLPRYLLVEARPTDASAIATAVWHLLEIVGPLVGRDGDLLCVVDVERMTCHPADTLLSLPHATRAMPQEIALSALLDPDDLGALGELLRRASESDCVIGPLRVHAGLPDNRRAVDVILRRWPGRPSLLIAMCRDVEHATQRGRGTAGRIHELETALTRVVESALDVLGASSADAVKALSAPALDRLSRREREVVLLLLRGMRVPNIAAQLFVSPSTVRNHLSRVFRKFGVTNQSELLQVLLERP